MFISTVKKPGGIRRRGVSEGEQRGRNGLYGNWPVCCNCSSGVGLWSELFNTAAGLVLDNCLNDLHGAWACVTTELIQGQPADLTESSSVPTLHTHPLRPNNPPVFHSFLSVYWTKAPGGVMLVLRVLAVRGMLAGAGDVLFVMGLKLSTVLKVRHTLNPVLLDIPFSCTLIWKCTEDLICKSGRNN